MTIDFSSVGQRVGPLEERYGWRDAALYALALAAESATTAHTAHHHATTSTPGLQTARIEASDPFTWVRYNKFRPGFRRPRSREVPTIVGVAGTGPASSAAFKGVESNVDKNRATVLLSF